jgi:hypothetical protein
MIDGDPDAGKSYFSHGLASCISTGHSPVGLPTVQIKQGSVCICAIEDNPGIIRYRLDQNGADCRNIHLVTAPLNVHTDIGPIKGFLDNHPDCRAIFLDPITEYVGDINLNSTSEVRHALGPLIQLAADRDFTLIGIGHLNKRQDLSSIYRTAGSGGFVQQARSVWRVFEDKDDPETRIFAPVKANYSIRPTGLKFRILDGRVTFFPDPWTGRLDDQHKTRSSKLRVEECADWLRDRLAAGAVLSTTVFEEAKEHHFNIDLCYRAKERLNLRATKAGYGGQWYWTLRDKGGDSKNGN